MLIAVDFDGVIHDPDKRLPGHRMGQPVEGALEALEALLNAGHEVVVHTVRSNADGHVDRWLDYFKVRGSVRVTNVKPNADVFLDDKAVRFTDWKSALREIA